MTQKIPPDWIDPTSGQIGSVVSEGTWPDDIDVAPTQAQAVATGADYQILASIWQRLKARIAEIEEFFDPRKREARRVWQRWIDDEKASLGQYPDAERRAARLLGQFDVRARERAELEQQRLQADAIRDADATRLSAALQAEANGAVEIADEILAAPPTASPVVTVASSTPTMAGLSMAGRWKAELLHRPGSLEKLIVMAAQEIRGNHLRVAASMLKEDQKAMNSMATSMKGNLAKIAAEMGLRCWEDRTPRRSLKR